MKKLIGVIVLILVIVGILALVGKGETEQNNVPTTGQETTQENTQTSDMMPTEPLQAGEYEVVASEGEVRWEASKVGGINQHDGTVQIIEGQFVVEGDLLTAANVTLDMTTILTDDGGKGSAQLDEHLKSEDFFAVETYPRASFVLTSATGAGSGGEFNATGDLTIRGITQEISFPVTLLQLATGQVVANAEIEVPRADFQVAVDGNGLEKLAQATLADTFKLNLRLLGVSEMNQEAMLDAAAEMDMDLESN